jgi:hypothetical protein
MELAGDHLGLGTWKEGKEKKYDLIDFTKFLFSAFLLYYKYSIPRYLTLF